MPSRTVTITWDQPHEETWLCNYNIEAALGQVCKNTKFTVISDPTEEPTPVAKAEAAREELEKFYAWCRPNAKMFAKRSVSDYLNDLRNGWKPEA